MYILNWLLVIFADKLIISNWFIEIKTLYLTENSKSIYWVKSIIMTRDENNRFIKIAN